jgi:hypothetical protein
MNSNQAVDGRWYGLWHLGEKAWMHVNGQLVWGPREVMRAQLKLWRDADKSPDKKQTSLIEVRPIDGGPALALPAGHA